RDETPSGYGFRFMQDYRAKGVSYEEGRAAILADPTTAGEWARRADVRANNERQLKRAWDRSKPKSKPDGSGKAQTLPSPANPMEVARLFVDQHCLHDNVLTLHHWRGTWWQWRSSYWCELENDAARSLLYNFTENARYHNDEGDLVPWAPTRKKIAALMEALAAITILDSDIDQPTWLDGRASGVIVAIANGLLEVETRNLLPHSPQFFNLTAVPFDYDKDAPRPQRWHDFLDAVWPNEPTAIDVLGEWFGYVISG